MQQLWFVPMIALFYLAAPLFIYIDRHPKWYGLLLVFAVVSLLVEREPFSDIPRMFVHFISVYLFGMFMSRYKKQYLDLAKKYWVLTTALTILVFALNLVWYDRYNNPFNYLQKMLLCCFFIYWAWKLDKYIPALLSVMADLSFGIFFIHYYLILVIKALYNKLSGHDIPGNILYWTIDLLLVLAGSILVIRLIKRIFPRQSRYLIGC
jgi:surface polysaccharide O-acyltransferase-like enzyme